MSKAKAKVWCRLIHKGEKTILDVDPEYRDLVRETYEELYHVPCPEPESNNEEEVVQNE